MTQVYDRIGVGYAELRTPDRRIAAQLVQALGDVASIVNIGAGTGSYEPTSVPVVAVEPSAVMIRQRPVGAAPAVQARAEALPFSDSTFDAALGVLTTHHWSDPAAGLAEMRRVSGRQVLLTWDQDVTAAQFWFIRDYLPEAAEREQELAALRTVQQHWPDAAVQVLPIPHDCTDGFFAAYWRRPEAFLDPAVRAAISGFALLGKRSVDAAVERLRADLASGAWQERYAHLMELAELDLGYRVVVNG